MKRILIGTPSYDGKVDVRYVDSLLNTLSVAANADIQVLPFFICNDSLVQRARNDIFAIAYNNKNIDQLVFIDSDIGWTPEDFMKIVMNENDMVGATYRKKHDDEELYAFKALETYKPGEPESYNIVPDSNGILEVRGIGCGFLKLSRKCLDIMWEKEPKYYSDQRGVIKNIFECIVNTDNNFVSEDIHMCEKWRELGGKVYLDTTITCTHTGTKTFNGNVANWLAAWKVRFDERDNKDKNTINMLTPYFMQDASISQTPDVDENLFKIL